MLGTMGTVLVSSPTLLASLLIYLGKDGPYDDGAWFFRVFSY